MPDIPKLIAFDLDGTLAESKQPITPQMGELLGKLLGKMPVAVMSGAGFPQFKLQFLAHLPQDAYLEHLYIFPDSAAQCFVYKHKENTPAESEQNWQTSYDLSFSVLERKEVLKTLERVLEEVGLAQVPVRVWGERIEDRGAEIAFSPLGQQAPIPEKQAWHEAHENLRQKLRNLLAAQLPDFAITTGGITTIDITRKGITKAYGITELAKMVGIALTDILYVGDALRPGGNDAVVLETGVPTHVVSGPEDSIQLITEILDSIDTV
jgi:phosphomannomutase